MAKRRNVTSAQSKPDETGWTPLIAAAGQGNVLAIQLLVDEGVDVNHGDVDGFTALMCAAGAGHADIVRLLITKGSEVDRVDVCLRTALSWALTKKDDVATVNALLELGANPNHIDGTGMTPLMRAALLKFPRSFAALLERGADSSLKHLPSGKTAVDMAVESGDRALLDSVQGLKRKTQNR